MGSFFNSHNIRFVHQHGRRFVVSELTNNDSMDAVTSRGNDLHS